MAHAAAAATQAETRVRGALASDRASSPRIDKTIDTGNGRPDSEVVALAKKVQALQRELVQSERREKHAERVADDAERRNEVLTTELKEANSKTQARDLESRELGRAVSVLKTENAGGARRVSPELVCIKQKRGPCVDNKKNARGARRVHPECCGISANMGPFLGNKKPSEALGG